MSLLRNLSTAVVAFGAVRNGAFLLFPDQTRFFFVPASAPPLDQTSRSLYRATGIAVLSFFALSYRVIQTGSDDDVRFICYLGAAANLAQFARNVIEPPAVGYPTVGYVALGSTAVALAAIGTFA